MHRRVVKSVQEALQQIRSLDRSMTKRAELGGDGQDIPFEQAFSNLAHAYLSDKAPSLLDHELGFQLLDRNDANTKAVGVFGFKVGSQMLYAPVFFLQGDLKGHELLYIKNQDMFVPLKENWLNYILNRKPNILGEGVNRDTNQLGVEQPDLNRLSKSPWKYASAMPPWVNEFMPKAAATSMTDIREEMAAWDREMDLKAFCKQATLEALNILIKFAQTYPTVATEITSHHGDLTFIAEAIRRAGSREKTASVLDEPPRPYVPPISGSVLDPPEWQHPIKTGALKVVQFDATVQTELPESVTEDDKEKLLRDGVLIKDERKGDEVSVPYNVRTEQKLFNPQETGLYMVLTKEREFKKCFVAIHPVGPTGRVDFATCVRLDGTPNWINCHPTRLWCNSRIEGKEYDTWYEGLTDRDSLTTSKTQRQMLVGPGYRTNSTLPFRVEKSLGDERGGQVYTVDFSDYTNYRYAESLLAPTRGRGYAYDADNGAWEAGAGYDKWEDGQRVHLDCKDGTKIRSSGGDVWIPEGYKCLPVEPTKNDKIEAKRKDDGTESCMPVCCGGDGQSENPPLRPGNILDAELEILTKTGSLKMAADSISVTINGHSMTRHEGLISLVAHHAFREDIAHELIKRATDHRKNGKTFECQVKYAFGAGDPYLTESGPSAPGFPAPEMGADNIMGFPGPTMSMSEHSMSVPGMQAQGNEGVYRPYNETGEPMDFDTIQQAMQTGQKEVFDTSMISSMLKAVRDDTMIDRYLPDLIKGMDRLGRILFMFYWHGDKFADRYGKMDMPELEDSLRNSFEQSGDTILFLKQKTIEPYPEEDSVDLDLNDAASV